MVHALTLTDGGVQGCAHDITFGIKSNMVAIWRAVGLDS